MDNECFLNLYIGCPHAKAQLEKLTAQKPKNDGSDSDQAKIMELQARAAQGCPHAAAQLKQMKAKDEL